jgi:hypothetical protein
MTATDSHPSIKPESKHPADISGRVDARPADETHISGVLNLIPEKEAERTIPIASQSITFAEAPIVPEIKSAEDILDDLNLADVGLGFRLLFARSGPPPHYCRPADTETRQSVLRRVNKLLARYNMSRAIFCCTTFLGVLILDVAGVLQSWGVAGIGMIGIVTAPIFVRSCVVCNNISTIGRLFAPADAAIVGRRVAEHVQSNSELAARWEGLLRHEEETGVPILKGDVLSILNKEIDKPEPESIAPKNTSAWRMV